MEWKLIDTSEEKFKECIGETGVLKFGLKKNTFIFSADGLGLNGVIKAFKCQTPECCEEVWIQSDIGEFKFSCVNYEKIGDVSFCKKQGKCVE